MNNFNTDLADERAEIIKGQSSVKDLDGIITETQNITDTICVSRVKVIDENGSNKIDKKIGNYITISINGLDILSNEDMDKSIEIFSKELCSLITKYSSILVVGLGNEDTTADSIGPKVVKNLEITRHVLKYKPELLPSNVREVSALAPGVLGTTGIETQEIIKSITDKMHFDAIIVIDALASNNVSRLLQTIQLCDTGIIPGSGVENKRKEISFETIGIPVIAIGVPTVVSTEVIVNDALNVLEQKHSEFKFLKNVSVDDKHKLLASTLETYNYNLVVMPKEIDDLVDNMKEIISSGINYCTNHFVN